ncbi:MAG: hypothetical protein NTW20_13000 [Rhodobacterales bacterium]|nr:hypothetical protein [Rhodobacterales bacterium]
MGVTENGGVRKPSAGVFRRHVLYIPGYDPFPPRRYRELYRKEGAEQAAISGYDLSLRPRAGETYGWHVNTRMDRPTEAEIEVLVWSDLVRASMGRGIVATYGALARTAWIYAASGALLQLLRLRKGPMIAALYPAILLVLQALLAALAGWLTLRLVPLPPLFVWPLAALAAWGVLEGFRRIDRRLYVHYLMHDFAYTAIERGAYPAALDARLATFRNRVRAAMGSSVDEVLVVGHSSGVHLGVTVLADLLREGLPAKSPALAFLSLGQAVPMASFLPGATRLRGDLAYLSTRGDLTWVDVSAPGDGCSFALCDPVAVSGVAPEGQRWPLVISAAFTQTLSPARWRALRWRFFRLHFQYLCAFDKPGSYDYFRITAGPMTLAARYANREASSSRISRALSPYRDVA